jgi:ketosteroid isomerase-like protein
MSDFDGVVEAYRQALVPFLQGDPGPVAELFSRREDVSLANPLGPARLGWAEVEKTIQEAAAHFKGGELRVEEVTRYAIADLGYVVQIERSEVQLAGIEDMAVISLRVTMIFRREGNTWKVAHRHADPITTARPISTAIDT